MLAPVFLLCLLRIHHLIKIAWVICFFCCALWHTKVLKVDEQLRIQHLTHFTVKNGPGLHFMNPFNVKSSIVVKAEKLAAMDYVRIRNQLDGSERTVGGPTLLFLGAYEKVEVKGYGISITSTQYICVEDHHSCTRRIERGPLIWIPRPQEEGHVHNAIRLSSGEYLIVQDALTGKKRVDKGPCVWFPGPHEECEKHSAVQLTNHECVVVKDKLTGNKRVETGPCMWFPGPYEEWKKDSSIWLDSTEYVSVQDTLTGQIRIEKGPRAWFPGPYDTWQKGEGVSLGRAQYMPVLNKSTGETLVVKGPCTWFPRPYEFPAGEVKEAMSLGPTQYIIVVNKSTGRQSVVKGPCNWFPTSDDRPSEVLEATVLQDDEYVKLKDTMTGKRWVHWGKCLLFLEPTWEIEDTSANSKGIKKSLALRGREYVRLSVAPHLRVTKNHRQSQEPPTAASSEH